ncbi:MAG: hypothetical protein NTW98_01810 [Candidatus Nomurabacteria bacterium]|nr:hypothetical protein [Candidatus Nomurabacteria bacterium]
MGLVPSDMVSLSVNTSKEGEVLVEKFKDELMKVVGANSVVFEENDGTAKSNEVGSPDTSAEVFREIKVDELTFKVKLEK